MISSTFVFSLVAIFLLGGPGMTTRRYRAGSWPVLGNPYTAAMKNPSKTAAKSPTKTALENPSLAALKNPYMAALKNPSSPSTANPVTRVSDVIWWRL